MIVKLKGIKGKRSENISLVVTLSKLPPLLTQYIHIHNEKKEKEKEEI